MECGHKRHVVIARRIYGEAAGRKWTMAMYKRERGAPQLPPYERIHLRVAIAIGVARWYGEREEAVKVESFVRRQNGIPRCDHTRAVPHGRKPMHIVLDSKSHTVEHRRKAVVEQSYYFIVDIHSGSLIILTVQAYNVKIDANVRFFTAFFSPGIIYFITGSENSAAAFPVVRAPVSSTDIPNA